jgi:hypothetical protein
LVPGRKTAAAAQVAAGHKPLAQHLKLAGLMVPQWNLTASRPLQDLSLLGGPGKMTVCTNHAATGVPGLDDILQGGLSRGHVFLLEGEPGAGKTTIALQFLLEGAKLPGRHGCPPPLSAAPSLQNIGTCRKIYP